MPASRRITIDRAVPGLGTDARLLAVPERTGPATAVVVVGTSLETVRRAQDRLALILVVVGPTLITLLAMGGWLLAHAALRPVGRMTTEADTMSLAEPGRRLRQPPGDDEIARLGRTLNTMLERMEASFAREKAFVDDASHELRTPISILRGELELALAQPGSREDTERTLRSALEEAERLGRLAEDLLVLARSTSGDLPLRRDRVDVHAVVERVAGRLATKGPPVVEIEGDHVAVDADLLRVEQVATNLITNARRFALDRVLVTIGLSLAVLLAACYPAVRWCLRPLRDLVAVISNVGPQNLGHRLRPGPGHDELAVLGRTIDDMMDRIATGYEAQRRFAADASHELRTPLAVQRTLIEVSMADDLTTEQLELLTEQLLATNERNERLIEGLLVLSESDRGLMTRTPLRLDEITAAVLDTYRKRAAEAGVTITADLRPRHRPRRAGAAGTPGHQPDPERPEIQPPGRAPSTSGSVTTPLWSSPTPATTCPRRRCRRCSNRSAAAPAPASTTAAAPGWGWPSPARSPRLTRA